MKLIRAFNGSLSPFGFLCKDTTGTIPFSPWLWLFCIAALSLALGCGRKGRPLPPLHDEPVAIEDLRAENRPAGILLSWSIPRVEGKGKKTWKFRVLRAKGPEPCKPCPEEWTPVAEIAVDPSMREQHGEYRMQVIDSEVSVGIVYRYYVISLTEAGGMSLPSSTVQILRE